MKDTKLLALEYTQEEWLAFIGEEFENHSRLEEIRTFCFMGFGSAHKISHERASELLEKAIAIFGQF